MEWIKTPLSKTLQGVIKKEMDGIIQGMAKGGTTLPPSLGSPLLTMANKGQKNADFQLTNAFPLSKVLGLAVEDVAMGLTQGLNKAVTGNGMVHSFEKSGKGFVNVRLDDGYLSEGVRGLIEDGVKGALQAKGVDTLIDYCSPNMGKQLHVGHLRSMVVGDCLGNLHEFVGCSVDRVSHVGDCGTPMGIVLMEAHERGGGVDGRQPHDVANWYVHGKHRVKQDVQFGKDVHEMVLALQKQLGAHNDGRDDGEVLELWKGVCGITRGGYESVYNRLGIHPEERGESRYIGMAKEVLGRLNGLGLLERSERGTVLRERPTMVVEKEDGAYLYSTTDICAMSDRIEKDGMKRLLYVVDSAQSLHFEGIFQIGREAGIIGEGVDIQHVKLGLVQGENGKKLSSRDGVSWTMDDLLNDATRHAAELMEWTDDGELAEKIAVGGIKYFELSQPRDRAYQFSFDRALSLKGNTSVYLMYAYTRLSRILERVGNVDGMSIENLLLDGEQNDVERELGLQLVRFGDCMASAVEDCMPHRICEGLWGIARQGHVMYESCPVIGVDEETQRRRIGLILATTRVLREGMEVLGVPVVERM